MALSQKDRKNLICALNVALTLYTRPEDRAHFARHIAETMALPLKEHFIEACLAEQIEPA